MKKLLSILLICTMLFCLAACGKDKEEITEADFVGNWECSYIVDVDGVDITETHGLEIYEGGAAYINIELYNVEADKKTDYRMDAKWELSEDKTVLTVTASELYNGIVESYKYNKELKTLTKQDEQEIVLTKEYQ